MLFRHHRKRRRKTRQHTRAGFDQAHRRTPWINVAKFVAQGMAGNFGQCTRQLYARRPPVRIPVNVTAHSG